MALTDYLATLTAQDLSKDVKQDLLPPARPYVDLLIVEDNPHVGPFFTAIFSRSGYTNITLADTGYDGYQQLSTKQWDLVSTDGTIPNKDSTQRTYSGVDLLELALQKGMSPSSLVLVTAELQSYASQAAQRLTLPAGTTIGIFEKPISLPDFKRKVIQEIFDKDLVSRIENHLTTFKIP